MKKKIDAVIQPFKLDPVRDALAAAGTAARKDIPRSARYSLATWPRRCVFAIVNAETWRFERDFRHARNDSRDFLRLVTRSYHYRSSA